MLWCYSYCFTCNHLICIWKFPSQSRGRNNSRIESPLVHYFDLKLQELDCLEKKEGLEQNWVPDWPTFKNKRGKKREESGHLCIVNVFYLYFHVYLMITYIEILHLCNFSVVATEPSAEQPWLRTDQTAAFSLYRQVQISRPQPASNVSSEYQR